VSALRPVASGLAILTMVLVVAGCRAAPGNIPVDVRNLSPDAITLVTQEPGPFLFPNTSTYVIEPWKQGRCFAHLGVDAGDIKVTVSGSNIRTPVTYTARAESADDHVAVQIDRDGNVQFGGSLPDDVLPCEGGGY
jgi:hypothetical protein